MKDIKNARGRREERIDLANQSRMFRKKYETETNFEDTNLRREIQKCIIEGTIKNKSKEEILNILKSREEFAKYEQYFEQWIMYRIGKNGIVHDSKTKKDNEDEKEL